MNIEELIRERVHFNKLARTGFNHIHCAVCNDHSPRAGFKFEDGKVVYNCFNCGADGVYTEGSGVMSNKFKKVLRAFSIPEEDFEKIVNKAFFDRKTDENANISLSDLQPKKEEKNYLITPEIELPKSCFQLGSTDRGIEIQERIIDYLLGRKIQIEDHTFYFSLDKKLLRHVIVPFYRNGKLIFWQGRNYTPTATKKDRYENCEASKENIIFNIDELFRGGNKPLFVSEGVFDAMGVNGIAIIGGKLNQAKLEILKKSRRRIIFVIDKDQNGKKIAEKVLENGFEITFSPPFTSDINDSIIKYGNCWTIYQLFKTIPSNSFEAKMLIELNCR